MTVQDLGSEQYIFEQFKRYYVSNRQLIDAPSKIDQREFGFLSFKSTSMFRHIGFKNIEKLRNYIKKNAPSHAYFSSAYYDYPTALMAEKGWLGADLVFDIDADHFELPCQKKHDTWICKTCSLKGVGNPPDICPKCGKASFIEENWLCEKCLEAAKNEAKKLLNILIQDFGFKASEEISINFSGNRGYHVHVRSQSIKDLDQITRREIVDYIMGTSIKAEYQGLRLGIGGESTSTQVGWRKRSVEALIDFIETTTPKQIKTLKLKPKSRRSILEKKEELLYTLKKEGPRTIFRYVDEKSLEKIMDIAANKQASAIDTVVTTDLRRLIRLPNTLHGKTGWLTQNVPLKNLVDYDPLKSAIAFTEGTEKVFIKKAPEIKIAGRTYGPFEEVCQELPLAVAMFLLCRKAARVVR